MRANRCSALARGIGTCPLGMRIEQGEQPVRALARGVEPFGLFQRLPHALDVSSLEEPGGEREQRLQCALGAPTLGPELTDAPQEQEVLRIAAAQSLELARGLRLVSVAQQHAHVAQLAIELAARNETVLARLAPRLRLDLL